MKRRVAFSIVITAILSVVVSLLENIVASAIQPSTEVQLIVATVLFIFSVLLLIAAQVLFQTEELTEFTKRIRRYASVWLIVLLLLSASLLFEVLGWKIAVVALMVLLLNVSAFGYLTTLNERPPQQPIFPSPLDSLPSPFTFESIVKEEDEEHV